MNIQELAKVHDQLYAEYENIYYKKYGKHLLCGTAGIRDKAYNLSYATFKTGIFQAVLSKINPKKALGCVISASHNPVEDNGIKLSDFDGSMLRSSYEVEQNRFIAESDLKKALDNLKQAVETAEKIQNFDLNTKGTVFVGYDTRPSSPDLVKLFIQAATLSGCDVKNFGEVTTPQIHFHISVFNSDIYNKNYSVYGFDTPEEKIQSYYNEFFAQTYSNLVNKPKQPQKLIIDCSNGVGGLRAQDLFDKLKEYFDVELINKSDVSKLNVDCGAEFVQKEQKFPNLGVETLKKYYAQGVDTRVACFDGDADRLVYFYADKDVTQLKLLDGDKLAVLYSYFIRKNLDKIIELNQSLASQNVVNYQKEDLTKWTQGVAFTAYANGNSVNFLEQSKIPVKIGPSGVKNLHHISLQFDLAVYFEANGHGTILVNNGKLEALNDYHNYLLSQKQSIQANHQEKFQDLLTHTSRLYQFLRLSNQAVGDAIADLLLVEAALNLFQMNIQQWDELYKQLPNLTTKVTVKNRTAIEVTWDHTKVTKPEGFQQQLEGIFSKFKNGRSFVRPSGTEDIVRIYIEADSWDDIKQIEKQVAELILSNKEIN